MGNYLSCMLFLFLLTASHPPDNKFQVGEIIIRGNKITKEIIILRELTFHKGDSILASDIEEQVKRSRENLLNISLFNYVTITSGKTETGRVSFDILVEERWYTWPVLILKYDDRNFSAWLKAGDLSKSKYGFSVQQYNCFGRRQTLMLTFLSGYTTEFSISYKNIALDKGRKHYLGGEYEISKQDEIIYNTINNEPVTFNNNYRQAYERIKYTLNYYYRPGIHNRNDFYLNYLKYRVADTLVRLNPCFLLKAKNRLECFTLDYVYTRDYRDIKAYPLTGSLFELLIGQTVSPPVDGKIFSSTVFIPSFYKYYQISNNLYYAAGINLKLSYNTDQSYIYSRSLGYVYNMHGFEYNTIEGQHFIVLKNLFKVAILKPKVTTLGFIPFKKFNKIHYAIYFNIYTDCGYVSDKYNNDSYNNDYANRFLISGGAGIDLVTYYDRTLRVEYSINGFGQDGIYLNLTAPINM
jgi:outer membrane protein assembly factor BamA